MNSPRAVLVDLNDTLFDGQELPRAVAETCVDLAAAGYGLGADRLLAANAEVWARLWPASESDWTLGRLTGAGLSLRGWCKTLTVCGCTDEVVVTLARDTHSAYALNALRRCDDVLDVLEVLKGHIALGIVWNGASDDQRERLAWFDLTRWFDPVVISAAVGVAKPDPTIFYRALEQLGVPAGEVWHVGDSLRLDVGGAQAAGISAVWLNRSGGPRPPGTLASDKEVFSLSELAGAISAGR